MMAFRLFLLLWCETLYEQDISYPLTKWPTFRRRQDKCIFIKSKCCVLITTSTKFVSGCPIDKKAAPLKVMTGRRTSDKPLPEPMLAQFTDAYMGRWVYAVWNVLDIAWCAMRSICTSTQQIRFHILLKTNFGWTMSRAKSRLAPSQWERYCYKVKQSLIGWAHTQKQPWCIASYYPGLSYRCRDNLTPVGCVTETFVAKVIKYCICYRCILFIYILKQPLTAHFFRQHTTSKSWGGGGGGHADVRVILD